MRLNFTALLHILLLSFSFHAVGQKQLIKTSRQAPFGSVVFAEQMRELYQNPPGFVDGYVRKNGSTPFIFPVGYIDSYRPFATDAGGISGAYFRENPQTSTNCDGAPFGSVADNSLLSKVSEVEFWDINGQTNTRVKLTWDEASGIGALTNNKLELLTIVGWNAASHRWEKVASAVDITSVLGGQSSITKGSITTSAPITPSTYAIYSLGSLLEANTVSEFEGNFEIVSCTELRGWVWDKNYPETELIVELFEGNTVYASIKANNYREDLKNSNTGSGRYGFTFKVPASILRDNNNLHHLGVRVSGTDFVVGGAPKALACSFDGAIDVTDCYTLSGWARDNNDLQHALDLDILEHGQVIASVKSDQFRQDAGGAAGNYGFNLMLPAALRDGRPHQIEVKARQSGFVLAGSPQTISCRAPNFRGSFELADCDKISGWAWDINSPNATLTVQIMEGATVIAEATAADYRSYLKDAGYGTGNYGFTVPVPQSLKDGNPHNLTVRVKGSEVYINGSRTITCVLNDYRGVFEYADCNTINGWAWDRNKPNGAVTVQVMDGGNVVAEAVASEYKSYLQDAGHGTGKYGFAIPVPQSLKDGNPHTLTVRIKGSSFNLTGSRSITCVVNDFRGVFEYADCNTINGWAWDRNKPNSAVTVQVMDGGNVVAEAVASEYKSYLQDAGHGTGKYGFTIPVPQSLKDGNPHTLTVRIKGSSFNLTGSRSITCVVNDFRGVFEYADCNTINGWAWDRNKPNGAVTVQVMDGGNVVAEAVASEYKSYLQDAGHGTGKYGFTIPVPQSLKDGNPHTLTVRIKGSSFNLTGSRSITCVTNDFRGVLEFADCNTINGWAWDRKKPDGAVTVQVMDGGNVVAEAAASEYKSYLQDAGHGTGKYGFTIQVPQSLKDGNPHTLTVRIKGSSFNLTGSRSITCVVNDFRGVFEFADCNTINGWAWDRNKPNGTVTVQVMDGGNVVAEAVAAEYKSYLQDAGHGTGKYGFTIQVPQSLKDGNPHTLTVRIKGSSFNLTGSRSITCVNNDFRGVLEFADCNTINGWAWDRKKPDGAVTVEILDGNSVVAEAVASEYKSYLQDAGHGTGKYGFTIKIPQSLKDGNPHALTARIKGSSFNLTGTRSITCFSNDFRGVFELADCNTISGWAWDRKKPDGAVTVQVMEGTNVVAETEASEFRSYLQDAGHGTGKYGFTIPLPLSLKDGNPHTLTVRIKGSDFTLTGTRTITCVLNDYRGTFELADCNTISGWAWDRKKPDGAVTVQVMEGTNVVAEAEASEFRSYLQDAGHGTGKYGFTIPLPQSLKDGNPHTLTVRIKGSDFTLTGSRTITCVLNDYRGTFEFADCNTISGWAWDRKKPDGAVTVQVMEGTNVVAEAEASEFRSYLQDAGHGTGKYGFTIPLPQSLKDGNPHTLTVRIKGSDFTLTGTRTITCVLNDYRGTFELADCNTISGWAWDRKKPDGAVTVQVMEGANVVAEAEASEFRSYLQDAGHGTGKYGFTIPLPQSLKDGNPHALTVRIKGSDFTLTGSRTITCVLNDYRGTFEFADCNTISGWAWDRKKPDGAVTVQVMEGTNVVAEAEASEFRSYLQDAGHGTGKYGFTIPLPQSLKDGNPHTLTVRIKGSDFTLTGSRTITCVLNDYRGTFEFADCNTISGWAWDRKKPDGAVTVQVMEGTNVVAEAEASEFRSYLQDAGHGTGKYGFTIPLPQSLKDGNPHTLTVRIKGSDFTLTGSRTITCMLNDYRGTFEFADCSTISGWAWDRKKPDGAVTVQVMEGTNVVAEAEASEFRSYLQDAGHGTGKYGFTIPLPQSLKDGNPHTLTVRIKGSDFTLTGTRTVTCIVNDYRGSFEFADCRMISGWVWDRKNPDAAVTVEILDSNKVIGEVAGNQYRYYLKDAGYGTGKYGFTFEVPQELRDGQPHPLSIRVKGSTFVLSGSRALTCASAARMSAGTSPDVETETVNKNQPVLPVQEVFELSLTVSPNPARGIVHAEFNIPADEKARIYLIDSKGQVLLQDLITGTGEIYRKELNLTSYTDGTYIIKVEQRKGVVAKRVVLAK